MEERIGKLLGVNSHLKGKTLDDFSCGTKLLIEYLNDKGEWAHVEGEVFECVFSREKELVLTATAQIIRKKEFEQLIIQEENNERTR